MTTQDLAAAMGRAEKVFRRHPEMGMHDDAPATARWERNTRVVASHTNGTQLSTDMPSELGGSGDQVTPGWLFRAGFASCAATTIVMAAAARGIELASLEVLASSRSDTRGLLGMADGEGQLIDAAPRDLQLHVRISASGVAPERLRAIVDEGCRCSPIPNAVQSALPVAISVDIE